MENYPSEESWKIGEYSKSNEKDEDLKWIWKKGLCLGKKIVLTSVVISSAPILVPPLVAISSFGFVCSLPVGFAIVTYACTEKLINTLLPMPSPLLLTDDRTKSKSKEEHRVEDDIEEGYEEDVDMEAEEEEFEEDTRMGVEMRIEFVDEVDNEIGGYEEIPVDTAEGDGSFQENEIVEEDGYEEDEEGYVESEEQHLDSNVIPDILEGIRQAQDEIAMARSGRDEMPSSSLQAVVVSAEVGGEDESNVEQVVEEMIGFEPGDREVEIGNTDMFSGINDEEMRSETMGLIEEMRDESTYQQAKQENEVVAGSSGNREFFVIPEEVKPIEDVDGLTNAPIMNDTLNRTGIQQDYGRKSEGVGSASLQTEMNPVVQENLAVHVNAIGGPTVIEARHGSDSDRKQGPLIISNEDAREIADESEFNLFDDDTLGSDQTTVTIDRSSEGEPFSDDIINANIDYHEVLVVSEATEPGDVTTAHKRDIKADSNKEPSSEEKIWEQIQAMRTIIGYKERPHPSLTEELKALYAITGVEPPGLREDLADVDEKLHFLMSIVGVK